MTKALSSPKRKPAVAQLIERDGDRCYWCGIRFKAVDGGPSYFRTLDHRVPRSRGGQASLRNLVLACYGCNHSKSDSSESEWETSKRLLQRRVGALRRELRWLGYKDDGAYWHRGQLLYVDVTKDTGWGIAECDRCGARGSSAELATVPCATATTE